MMQFTIIIFSMAISLVFMQTKHPLAMGLTLLVQTFLVCLITGTMTKTFWFSYTLFLIFLGGMLVLFIYVTSLASNEMFSFSMNMFIIMSTTTFILTTMILFMDKSIISSFLMNHEMINNSFLINMIKENSINLNKLYNFPTNMITILLINYLLLTLIIIVKITNNFMGPLRPLN